MSHTPREKRSKNKDVFRPPQTPPRSSTAVVESPHHQMTSHGTRLKNSGQMLPPGEIANSSQVVLRTAMRSAHPSTVMQNPSVNINSTQQRTLSVKQYGAGYIKTTTFNDHVSMVKQHGEGGIKPKIGGMDHLYDRLMTLKEPVLDEILKVIDDAKKRKLAKTFQQRQYHGTDNDSSDGDDEGEDEDDVNGEKAYKLKAKGLPWKKRKHHRHHSKKVDYHKSIGFRNFFKIFKKKNRDRPVPDLVRCAKEAYKMLSTASRYRYRNLRRYKTAGIVRRRVKPCSDTEDN